MENHIVLSSKEDENAGEGQSDKAYSFDCSRLSLFVNQRSSNSSNEKKVGSENSSRSKSGEEEKAQDQIFDSPTKLKGGLLQRSGENIKRVTSHWNRFREAKTMCEFSWGLYFDWRTL